MAVISVVRIEVSDEESRGAARQIAPMLGCCWPLHQPSIGTTSRVCWVLICTPESHPSNETDIHSPGI